MLRGLGGERVFSACFAAAADEVAVAAARTAVLQSVLDGAQVFFPGALVVAVTWLGAYFTFHGELSAGSLVAFYAAAAFLVIPMQTFTEAGSKLTAALVASRRIVGVLSMQRRLVDGSGGVGNDPGGPCQGFGSAAAHGLLEDESGGLRLQPGRFAAVVPATPDEGSAILDRLGRHADPPPLYEALAGGRPIRRLPLGRLRRQVLVLERSPVHLGGRLGELLC